MFDRRTIFRRLVILLAVTVALPAVARADAIFVSSGGSFTTTPTLPDVTILRIAEGKLFYRTASNVERSVPLNEVLYIQTPRDAIFDGAEQAFTSGDFDRAVDGYGRVLRNGTDWKQRRAAERMAIAAGKTNRFEAALAAYITLARLDPAAAVKPKLPSRGSRYLDDAVKLLEPAANAAKNDAEKQALLSLLVDVQLAQGNQTAAATSTDQLATAAANVKATAASGSSASGDAQAAAANTGATAVARLAQAREALVSGEADKVEGIIHSAAAVLATADQQAEALALVARAKTAIAEASKDPTARRDAAIAWLRLVAHFGQAGGPGGIGEQYVGEALLAAAQQQAATGDIDAARALLEQLIAERPGSRAATLAADRLAKLSPSSAGQ